MLIKKIPLKDLTPSPYNPRVISDEELKKLEDSMDKFGYVEPIIWNKRTNRVVGGHQRLKVLQRKMQPDEQIEVVEVDLDEYQEKALNLALNKIMGDWNEEALSKLLAEIKGKDEDLLKYTGFSQGEITNLLTTLSTEIPELKFQGSVGNQTNQRFFITFFFDTMDEYDKAMKFFKQLNGKEPDTKKLLGLIK